MGNNEPYFSNKSTSLGQQKSQTNLQQEKLFMRFCEDEFYMKPNKWRQTREEEGGNISPHGSSRHF